MTMILAEPYATHRSAFMSFLTEVAAAGEVNRVAAVSDPDFNYDAHVAQLAAEARGENLPAGFIASRTFFLLAGRELLGVSRLRLELTPTLRLEGGHIGYYIRPSVRRLGFGTKILALTLVEARKAGF